MVAGLSLLASPSTCIGMVRLVLMTADLHWPMQIPFPPASSFGSVLVVNPMTSMRPSSILCSPNCDVSIVSHRANRRSYSNINSGFTLTELFHGLVPELK